MDGKGTILQVGLNRGLQGEYRLSENRARAIASAPVPVEPDPSFLETGESKAIGSCEVALEEGALVAQGLTWEIAARPAPGTYWLSPTFRYDEAAGVLELLCVSLDRQPTWEGQRPISIAPEPADDEQEDQPPEKRWHVATRILPELDDYDWEHAFLNAGKPEPVAGDDPVSLQAFRRADVAQVIALSEGEPDGDAWVGVFRLLDGRFAFLEAGCDSTGWD